MEVENESNNVKKNKRFQHCGQNVPTPNLFTSTGNQMYVRMKADGSVAAKGFIANYTWVKS
jgi:hypothetical protein